jgi:hypothetical protein
MIKQQSLNSFTKAMQPMKSALFIAIISITYLHNYAQLKVSCTGTSITAGYGVADSLSYPGKMQTTAGVPKAFEMLIISITYYFFQRLFFT